MDSVITPNGDDEKTEAKRGQEICPSLSSVKLSVAMFHSRSKSCAVSREIEDEEKTDLE